MNGPTTPPEFDDLTDVRRLRALTHPVRIALLEVLTVDGPMTATQAGEEIGESATTCSFHLRQLAKYRFVEEAGGGKGRARPWKVTTLGMDIPESDDPETQVAGATLQSMFLERMFERHKDWLRTRNAYPTVWREAAGNTEVLLYLTPEELVQIREDVVAKLYPTFAERIADPAARPHGAVPVELLLLTYPIRLPKGE